MVSDLALRIGEAVARDPRSQRLRLQPVWGGGDCLNWDQDN
ncbi:hypothetical protein CYA_2007 [Synechococcus sp. JA-3-3Ab]|nr:hypothetical protein CYA_2007 [Synechococcus sp. JA-3-3Ab]